MWCSWEPQIRARIRSHGAALIRGVRKIMFVITGSTHSTTHTHSIEKKLYLYLFCAEQGWRSWSPEQLTEPILVVLLEEPALERPQPVRIVHLART